MKSLRPGALAVMLLILLQLINSPELKGQSALSIGPLIAAGTSTFPENGRLALGFTFQYSPALHRAGNLTFSTGYMWFDQRFLRVDYRTLRDSILKMGVNGYDISFIPVTVGYQRFVYRQAVFLSAEVGASIVKTGMEDPQDEIADVGFSYAINCSTMTSMHLLWQALIEGQTVTWIRITGRLGEYTGRRIHRSRWKHLAG
jgi:hypothetical protein